MSASQPPKQSSSRRLPPISNVFNKPNIVSKLSRSPITAIGAAGVGAKPTVKPDMVVTGYSPTNNGSRSGNSSDQTDAKERAASYTGARESDMTTHSVTQYLHDNPDFLDKYVHQNVHRSRIDKWLLLKPRLSAKKDTGADQAKGKYGEAFSDKSQACLYTNKRRLLQDLIKDFHLMANKEHVLFELGMCIASAIHADGINMYLVESEAFAYFYKNLASDGFLPQKTEILKCYQSPDFADPTTVRIDPTTTIAGYVAAKRDTVRIGGPTKVKAKFPLGMMVDVTPETVIAMPVLSNSGEIIGVAELYRRNGSPHFTHQDEEVSLWHLSWTDVILQHCELYNSMTRQRKLNDFLLTVTKSIFQDIVSMDTVIMKIMVRQSDGYLIVQALPVTYAKRLVNADRASLFLLDTRTNELYARIFDTGTRESTEPNPIFQREIRFPIDRGVAGHVATTGEILNIPDAYLDERFNRDVDLQTGYKTRTILCMPIYIRGSIIGVVQMVNKINGTFTKSDEEAFETFAIYCGLALHHAKLYDKIRKSEQKYKVALEVLSYHSQCSEEEIGLLESTEIPQSIPDIASYDFSPWGVSVDDKPIYIIYMFKELFNLTQYSNTKEDRFDVTDLIRFTLTVRKNYRNVPYHNWTHAFSVAHAMYTIIQTSKHHFSGLECLALFVACMCHDLDHRGKTNAFMVKSASPLAAVYSTSTMEHHHFNQTVTILQHDGHNIFKHMTSEEYKQVLGDIRHCILATDLALFFGNKAKLQDISDSNIFDWNNAEHRRLTMCLAMTGSDLCASMKPWPQQIQIVTDIFDEFYLQLIMSVTMTASDLCAMYKSWDLQYNLVHIIMEEFWQQGDEERALGNEPTPMMDRRASANLPQYQGDVEKAQGIQPLPMMDREKRDELPQLEVGFIVGICLPCYELLAHIIPETRPMANGAKTNLKRWQELADENNMAAARKEKMDRDVFDATELVDVESNGEDQTLEITRDTKSNLLIGKLTKISDKGGNGINSGSYTKGDNQNNQILQTS